MPPLDSLQPGAASQTNAPSTTEATNATQLTQVLGKLVEGLSSQGGDVVAAIEAITSAVTASLIGGTTGTTINRVLVAKGTTGRALQATPVTIDPSTGNIDTHGADLTVDDITADVIGATTVNATNGAFSSTLTKGGANLAIVTQTICASFTFKFPEDETVALILNSPFAWTITETNTITEVGTSTVTTKIGTTALGGGANSASTSLNTVAQASANSVALTNQINVTFASTSSDCENLCLTIVGTRVLDS